MENNTELEKSIKLLEEFCQLEGTELGEAWDKLIYIEQYDYCFSKEFNEAVQKEIIQQAKDAQEQFEIIEEEEIRPKRKVRVLREKSN